MHRALLRPWIGLRIAIKALRRHKLRTLLTLLGVIIGVAAVITMVALGRGARQSVETEVRSAGTNLILVSAGNYTRGGDAIGIPSGRGAAATLTPADAEEIARIPGVRHLAAGVSDRAPVTAGARRTFTVVQGTDAALPLIHGWSLRRGQFFTRDQVDRAAAVAVVGPGASAKLFGADADPLGEAIQIRDRVVTVIGVAEIGAGDQADAVFVPYTVLQQMLGITHLHTITVGAEQAGESSAIAAQISARLRERHRLAAGDPDDFTVKTQAGQALTQGLYTSVAAFALANLPKLDEVTLEEMAGTLGQASMTLTVLLASLAAVSLIVGGIGIMNIMLVAVTERTREIGIRRAVGARARDVLMQFLVEAVTLSLVGGAIGILCGFLASAALTRLMDWPTEPSPGAVALAFTIALAVGVLFGFYPARKASRLDPIEALRHE